MKRYNLLVNAVFPVTEPSVTKPLALSTEKSIKRLTEYLERNEHRIPKVSRRLARRLHADLARRRYGYVRVAVTAYLSLITAEEGRFSRAVAKELLLRYPTKTRHFWTVGRRSSPFTPQQAQLGSVVGALMAVNEPLAQLWGAHLLTAFAKQQDSAEYIHALEAFVPLLCEKTAEASQAVQVVEDSLHVGGIPAACFHTLLEHLRLCSRISYVSMHLDLITYAVLNVIESEAASLSAFSTAPPSEPQPPPQDQRQRAFLSQTSIGSRVGASSPGIAAFLVYQEIGRLTRDAAEGRKVLEFLLRFLDDKPVRWQGGPAVTFGLGVMRDACTHEQQRLMMAAALIGHVSSVGPAGGERQAGSMKAKLTAQARSAVLTQAMKDALSIDTSSTVAAPLLLLALQEYPKALMLPTLSDVNDSHQSSMEDSRKQLEDNVLASIGMLARQQGSCVRLTSVLSAAFSRLPVTQTPLGLAALRCYRAASEACSGFEQSLSDPGVMTTTTAAAAAAATTRREVSMFLLSAVLGVCVRWNPPARVHSHAILQNVLFSGQFSLRRKHIRLIYSSIWHECVGTSDVSLGPLNFVSISTTLTAALGCCDLNKDTHQYETVIGEGCLLALSLQSWAFSELHGDFKDGTQASRSWAVLATAASLMSHLSRLTGVSELRKLVEYPKAGSALKSIGLDKDGCLYLVGDAPPQMEAILQPCLFTAEDDSFAEAQLKGKIHESRDPWRALSSIQGLAPYLSPNHTKREKEPFVPLTVSEIVPSLSLGLLNGAKPVEMSAPTRKFLAAFRARGGDGQERGGEEVNGSDVGAAVLNGSGLVHENGGIERGDRKGQQQELTQRLPVTVEDVVADFEEACKACERQQQGGS